MSKKIIKNTVIYSIGEVVPKLLGFLLLPIYTHYLSPADYGIISYTSAVMVFLPAFSTLCLNSFLLRFFFERDHDVERQKLVGNVFSFIAIVNLFIFFIGYFFIPKLINRFHIRIPWDPYFKLAFIAYFLEVFSIIPLAFYRVRQNAKIFVALNLGKVITQYILILVLIVFFEKGVLAFYYGNVIALIPFFLIYLVIIFKQSIINLNWKEIKEGLRFSLPLLPGAISYLLIDFSDRIFLERSVSMAEIGIYNIAYTLSFSLNMIILSVYRAIEPEIFKRYNDSDEFEDFIYRAKSVFFFSIYLAAMFVTLFSQEFFKIMAPPNYFNGYLYVPIIIVGVIMTGQNIIFGGILAAEKSTKIIGLATLAGVIFNIIFNIIFIPLFGVFAAAISTAISFTVINVILYLSMRVKSKSMKQEAIALGTFISIFISIFFIFKIEVSINNFLIKILLFVLYFLFLLNVFSIQFNSIISSIKGKIWVGIKIGK